MAGSIVFVRQGDVPGQNVYYQEYLMTADAAAGTFPTTSSMPINGKILSVVTKPGATQPQAAYDITLSDSDGANVMGTTLNDRAAAAAEKVVPAVPPYVIGPLSIAVANNNVNSAVVTLKIIIER